MKRVVNLLLALVLSLGLYACGQNTPTWQEQYDLGMRYLSEGNYEEAIIAFTAAIEIDPNQADAYVGRGDAYVGSGETEENLAAAQADYETALELDDALVAAWLGLADIFIRSGQYDKAQDILMEALGKTGNNPSISGKIDEVSNLTSDDLEDAENTDEAVPPRKGLLIRENWYNENGLWNYTEYFYNESGICIEEKTTLHDGEVQEHVKYDAHGNIIWRMSDGDITEYQNFYDEGNRLIRQESNLSTTYYHYDEGGKIVRYESDATHGVDEYDDSGNLIFEEWSWSDDLDRDYAGLLINRYYHEYNENGLITKSIWPEITEGIWRPHEGWVRTYEYEYDENGVPIKKIRYENGEKTSDWWEFIYS